MKENSNRMSVTEKKRKGRKRSYGGIPELSVGLDLGDRRSCYAMVDAAGELVEEGEFANTQAGLEGVLGGRPRARVALETGSQSGWIARTIEAMGHEVLVAHARELRGIWGAPRKNDRRDAAKLARYARLDPELLKPTRLRSAGGQLELSRLRVREALVRSRTLLVNAARGLAKAHGERIVKTSTAAFGRRARLSLSAEAAAVLEPLLEQVEGLSKRIREADRELLQAAERHPDASRLMTANGVGPLTALTFVHTIEDPRRFRRSREVGPYLGLTPKQAQSGDADPQLGITKAGDERLRRLLVQCAHHILGPFGQDSSLRRWGLRFCERGGKNARKRAVVALARKLAVALHRMWVTGERWRAFPEQA